MARPSDAVVRWACEVTGSGAMSSATSVQTLWSGYGQIWRLRLEPFGSIIIKDVRWPAEVVHPRGWATGRSHARKVRSYAVEAAWYRNHAAGCAMARVPRCFGVQETDQGVLMALEDLDAAGFSGRGIVERGALEACLAWLARFHATFLGRVPDDLWREGTYWHFETRPDEWNALPEGPLKVAAPEVARRLREAPFPTLVHGDAKLANFCFGPPGEVAAVDFQYVGGGCGMKDVAYFISSCVDERDADAVAPKLLDHYFAVLREAVSGVDPDVLEAAWRPMYAVAWTDFYRFLQGWSPGHPKIHRYSERQVRTVLGGQ